MAHKKGHKMGKMGGTKTASMGSKGKSHTGPVTHSDMGSYIDGHGGKDPHASSEHHSANSEHDMTDGMSPTGSYHDQDVHGGESMGDNESQC